MREIKHDGRKHKNVARWQCKFQRYGTPRPPVLPSRQIARPAPIRGAGRAGCGQPQTVPTKRVRRQMLADSWLSKVTKNNYVGSKSLVAFVAANLIPLPFAANLKQKSGMKHQKQKGAIQKMCYSIISKVIRIDYINIDKEELCKLLPVGVLIKLYSYD